ncbi:DUF4232 domain-containing protein [Streptomyces sp. NEAU-S7GS2]|uniref:DUF4232 domain-containing protein n=1 Tax=Streptomyces sp. NEAU-S7GS2 TaxID=2202000 RepID=UPI000D6FA68F|nr:DUF4232 domain-containing protein [Streptomyces sp. NEAU-S7GS2]AWN25011.1 hypothetical protein DKG71_01600 [Streptomyces sp. NEAU-S7GS2]
MRTSRISTTVLAATAAALALTLTACGGSDSAAGAKAGTSRSGGTADDSKASDKTSETGGGKGTGAQAITATGHGASASGSQAGSGKVITVGSTDTRQCHGDEISYSVLHRFPKQQGEHLLITARNADSKPCWVTSYPSVILGDTSNVLRLSPKDAPGGNTRITLHPGGKVYSAVNLFTDSTATHTSGTFSLALRDQTGDTGPATEQDTFDGKGVPSKFSWTSADVTNWNTTKPYDF